MSRLRPEGAGAVMADRARGEVEGDDPQTALYRKLEFFPTPPWAARAGGALIKRLDPEVSLTWEPAAGGGHMAMALAEYFPDIFISDVHAYGGHGPLHRLDFLSDEAGDWAAKRPIDWIVTNPPFATASEFVRLGLQRARRGVAILARAAFFESAGRYPLFFGDTPLTVYAPFFERVPMVLGRWDPKASTATAYAWFIWDKAAFGRDKPPIVLPIPPGTRERLTRPDDAGRWAAPAAAPLFDGPAASGARTGGQL